MTRLEGIILAGGRSERMGRDKALLPIGGVPLLRILAERMSAHCGRIWIACGDETRIERYLAAVAGVESAEIRFAPDVVPGCGPMSGLHAVLTAMPENGGWALALACDMPQLSESLLQRMRMAAVAAEQAGRPAGAVHAPGEPMHALYHKRALPVLQTQLERGDYRMLRLLERVDAVTVEPETEEQRAAFRNLNTPGDLTSFHE